MISSPSGTLKDASSLRKASIFFVRRKRKDHNGNSQAGNFARIQTDTEFRNYFTTLTIPIFKPVVKEGTPHEKHAFSENSQDNFYSF